MIAIRFCAHVIDVAREVNPGIAALDDAHGCLGHAARVAGADLFVKTNGPAGGDGVGDKGPACETLRRRIGLPPHSQPAARPAWPSPFPTAQGRRSARSLRGHDSDRPPAPPRSGFRPGVENRSSSASGARSVNPRIRFAWDDFGALAAPLKTAWGHPASDLPSRPHCRGQSEALCSPHEIAAPPRSPDSVSATSRAAPRVQGFHRLRRSRRSPQRDAHDRRCPSHRRTAA